MNILQLEQERTALQEKLKPSFSAKARIILLYDFFEKVISTRDNNLIESYLPEFIPDYIFCMKVFSVFGLKPRIHESLIEQAEKIEQSGCLRESGIKNLTSTITLLKNNLEILHRTLNGEKAQAAESSKAYFPLLEEDAIREKGITIGLIEFVTIKIQKTKSSDKFIIIPSEKEIEEKISEQVRLSWLNATNSAKKYVKRIHPFHEVIISFDRKAGFCKGNSLGTALSLAFIEELMKTYNSPVAMKIGNSVAFTGGIDELGRITNTSEEIIKQKTEIVFYSDTKLFVVPKNEEDKSNEKLEELKKEYHNRDLQIYGAEKLSDVLNRRDLVEIKKSNPVVRSAKFAKKNWAALLVILILSSIISFFIIRDIDTNPYSFRVDGSVVFVLNKSGKLLWEKNAITSKAQMEDPIELKDKIKIVDIDSDGRNELLIAIEKYTDAKPDSEFHRITCYNSEGEFLWNYSFKDKAISKRTELPPLYNIVILDTLTFNEQKNVFLNANNSPSFSSAIFRLDLKTGKRLPGTFWSSGHNLSSIIKDIDSDGRSDVLCVGVDNGYENAVFYGFEIDTLTVVRPTTDEYRIRGYPIANLITYIRFPKTDYDEYKKFRSPAPNPYSFIDRPSQKYYQFFTMDFLNDNTSCLWYQVDYNLEDINIVVDSRFRVIRDSLVAQGELNLPFTDTPEYVNLQKSKILYYKNSGWVKREELE